MQNRNKGKRGVTRQTVYRIIAIILALLFVGGIVAAAIPLFSDEPEPDLSRLSSDTCVKVGLSYGKSVYSTFNLSSPDGCYIGVPGEGESVVKIAETAESGVMAALDANYYKKNGSYSLESASDRTPSLGAYHLVDINMFATYEEALFEYREIYPYIDRGTLFLGYVGNMYMIFLGSYFTYSEAQSALDSLTLKSSFFVMSPNPSAVRLIDAGTEQDLFITDSGLSVVPAGIGPRAYIETPSGYRYEGRFDFTKYTEEGVTGLQLVNTVDLESYVYGVVPWEIGADTPLEALKAQAILARTYALQSLGKHSAYGFDLCKTQHCQVYYGISRGNANVLDAVAETAGQAVTYEGELAAVYYSAVSGGTTVSSYDAWGGTYVPYLVGMTTEWEKYEDHPNGVWTSEVSSTRLCEILKSKGYGVSGQIADVEILAYAENSEYVRSIRFTDTSGKSVTVEFSDNIRSLLSSEVHSACFTVAKREVSEPEYIEHIVPAQVLTGSGTAAIPGNRNMIVSTGSGVLSLRADDSHRVLTAGGYASFSLSDEYAFNGRADAENERMRREYESADSVFVFEGKGWGHGVGMSQYGARDLAAEGRTVAEIIAAYFPGTEIKNKDEISG